MKVDYKRLCKVFHVVLVSKGFDDRKAEKCATLFADASLDGVASHGLNRFPEFIRLLDAGYVNSKAEPSLDFSLPVFERWNGNLGAGPLNAGFAMDRAISMAKEQGIGVVALHRTNHWKRGGNFGWQAGKAGCIAICFTNTLPNMPAWGAKEPKLGNNPLVIALPKKPAPMVLDMAMTQFSYGKMLAYLRQGKEMPYPAGFDQNGEMTKNPEPILAHNLALPMGMWKGAGLAMMLDLIASLLSGGLSTHEIGKLEEEHAISQFFLCLYPPKLGMNEGEMQQKLEAWVEDLKEANTFSDGPSVFPGENSLKNRAHNLKHGVPVDKVIWEEVVGMLDQK
ncbi:3-dehydro-L-gulonate 2-dehydrogenase [Pleomorphovibrio marinus]|uniref:3-dehydro-L-gulonate 2-dehydrogenase n=1 Tax=Pleomorphovibrio marinus TaxID=2164132 RepID=UPI001E658088|nr:3-dehydro-L-gulonate 2-dehydrogenase [Pleomorphovibrio marinus]